MPAHADAVEIAVTAAHAADDKKATDLTLLEVADVLAVVDLFLLATARNDRQLKAIAEEIERKTRETHDRRPLRREGAADSGWMLLDYGDLVCHLFSEDQRNFYALDRLWSDVPQRDPLTGEIVREGAPAAPAETITAGEPR